MIADVHIRLTRPYKCEALSNGRKKIISNRLAFKNRLEDRYIAIANKYPDNTRMIRSSKRIFSAHLSFQTIF